MMMMTSSKMRYFGSLVCTTLLVMVVIIATTTTSASSLLDKDAAATPPPAEQQQQQHDGDNHDEHEIVVEDEATKALLDRLPTEVKDKLSAMWHMANQGLREAAGGDHHDDGSGNDDDALVDDENVPELDTDAFTGDEQHRRMEAIEHDGEDGDATTTTEEDNDEDEMMHHHSHPQVVLSEAEEKILFGMIRKQRSKPWEFPELLPSILHGVDFLTVATLDVPTFRAHKKELLDAWLALFHSNVTELHVRTVQVIHIIKQRYHELVLDEMDRLYRKLPTRARDMSRLFDLMRVSELLGLPYTFEPIHKYWQVYWEMWRKAQEASTTPIPSNMTHQTLMTAVLGWDPATYAHNHSVTNFKDISHALILLYNVERQSLKLPDVTFADVAALVAARRPYKGPKELSAEEYENQVFMVLNFVQVQTDFGLTHVAAHLMPDEQTLLREAIYFGVAHNNTQLVGEVVNALQLMHVGETDADITLAKTFLVNMQQQDGSWRQTGHRMHLGILDTYRAIIALCPHNTAWLTGDDGNHLTNELLSNSRYHEMIRKIRLAGHLEPAQEAVNDHVGYYKHHLRDEL